MERNYFPVMVNVQKYGRLNASSIQVEIILLVSVIWMSSKGGSWSKVEVFL